LGIAGLFRANRSRATAIVGLGLGGCACFWPFRARWGTEANEDNKQNSDNERLSQLNEPEQMPYVEQELERFLSIRDRPVRREIPR
jgi:hypothetical protein